MPTPVLPSTLPDPSCTLVSLAARLGAQVEVDLRTRTVERVLVLPGTLAPHVDDTGSNLYAECVAEHQHSAPDGELSQEALTDASSLVVPQSIAGGLTSASVADLTFRHTAQDRGVNIASTGIADCTHPRVSVSYLVSLQVYVDRVRREITHAENIEGPQPHLLTDSGVDTAEVDLTRHTPVWAQCLHCGALRTPHRELLPNDDIARAYEIGETVDWPLW